MNRNPADLPKSTDAKGRQEIVEMGSRHNSKYKNPCIKEQELSLKCLADNNYDKDACEAEFANYVCCQKFWTKIKTDRRRNGITPELPRPEERETIKAEYMKKWYGT